MSARETEKILKALANKRRIAILKLLHKQKEINVTELAEGIDLSFRATSQHLHVLENAGFVETRQENTMVFYRKTDIHTSLVKYILNRS